MNYPESIYRTYEIAEKDIYGEKHYALVRVYDIFGFKIRMKIKMYEFSCEHGVAGLKTWYKDRKDIEYAIEGSRRNAEARFRKKVTK